jgi:hypothetical protein
MTEGGKELKIIEFPGFCGPTYQTLSPVFGSERAINLYPELPARGASTKTSAALIGRPGLSAFSTNVAGQCRVLWAGNNRLFVMGGTNFYELTNAGAIGTNYGAMAGSGGAGPGTVRANGVQLLALDRSAGQVYNANPAGPAMTSVFNGVALEFLDGFYASIATGASLVGVNPNQMNVSNFMDGTTWNALNYVIRTTSADLIWQLQQINRMLVIFGQKTTSFWYNTGNPLFPFAEYQGGTMAIGCLAPFSVSKFQNTIVWLGGDDNGYAQVYALKGMGAERVSNPCIEQFLDTYGRVYDISKAWSFGYQESGHTFFVLNIVDNSYIPKASLVYDLTNGLWHERFYSGPYPVCFASLPGSFTLAGNRFVGDGNGNTVLFQSVVNPSDAGTAIAYTRVTPHSGAYNKRFSYGSIEVDADVGTAQLKMSLSDDGGRTFKTLSRSDATQAASGDTTPVGGFGRFIWKQDGESRDRVWRFDITNSTQLVRLQGAYLGIDPSNEP